MPPLDAELEAKQRELIALRKRANSLEGEILEASAGVPWRLTGFYTMYYATTGFMLGLVAASISLLVNVIGAPIVGKSPVELISVYLTFPLGEKALSLGSATSNVYAISNGTILAMGICLYLATGMLLGIPFHVLLSRFTATASTTRRLVFASALGLILWGIMFYGVLAWLQPMVCGGSWITDGELLPPWVAAATHVVFGATMVLVYPFGQFVPYAPPSVPESSD